jgi:hypothetical protein
MAATLDTLKIAKRLEAAGMEPRAAEALAEVLHDREQATDQRLATKADLEAGLNRLEARVEARIAEAKFDLLKWIVPVLAAQLLALIGLYFK